MYFSMSDWQRIENSAKFFLTTIEKLSTHFSVASLIYGETVLSDYVAIVIQFSD